MTPFDEEVDFLVVGSGAAGLTAAIAAQARGLRALVVEKTDRVGGTTAYSGGALWIPNNPVSRAAGVEDSRSEGLEYMNACIGEVGPASSPERKAAYLDRGAEVVQFLQDAGFRWRLSTGYPDYYPELPGGKVSGRSLEPEVFDTHELGEWEYILRANVGMPPLPAYSHEISDFLMLVRTVKGFTTSAQIIGARMIGGRLRGKRLVTVGNALIARLLKIAIDRGITIRRNTPLVDLIMDDGAAVGVVVVHDGAQVRIGAHRGVLLAAGGFSRNLAMRQKYQKGPADVNWTAVAPGDTGEVQATAIEAGAATAMMEHAWWMPTTVDPVTGAVAMVVWERSMPHSIVVNAEGQRFANESAPYQDFGDAILEGNRHTSTVPCWLIVDSQHRRHYPFGAFPPGVTPRSAIKSGFLVRAATIDELAQKIGVPPANLRSTVQRFNAFARTGNDADYGRGNSKYDQFYGDPRNSPNPNLGALERAPFYAAKLWPGDIGTKGGLLTDEHGRVLRENDDEPIPGLYATGNTTATVMGDSYPGAGATIGPAVVFGYAAALHAAEARSAATGVK